MFIFLCVARMFHFKEQDPQKQPNKHYQVENMATTCYPGHPGQLCVVFDVCFQLQPIVLSGCLAAPSV